MRAIVIVAFVFAFVSSAFAAPNHVAAVPPGAELSHFPVVSGKEVPKTAKQEYELEAKLGLRPVALQVSLRAFNHYRVDNSWRFEEISAGAIVFVDASGVVRYKADCWNRLVVERSWLDELLAWLGGLGSRTWGAVTGWVAILVAFILGILFGRASAPALPANPVPHVPAQPPAPVNAQV